LDQWVCGKAQAARYIPWVGKISSTH
jgi:hypothetical protein